MHVNDVLEAVNKFFGDTSRTQEETAEGLEQVASHIEFMLDTLEKEKGARRPLSASHT